MFVKGNCCSGAPFEETAMRIGIVQTLGVCLLALAVLAPTAEAQSRRRSYSRSSTPAMILAERQIVVGQVPPAVTNIRIQSTVTVPDGGEALLGGYSRASEGRSEYGAPLAGKVPILGRGFRNVGYGRSFSSTRVSVRVRIISLREEEYRQTGFRSP
jgi:Flp pilus assembly secretin CpaC